MVAAAVVVVVVSAAVVAAASEVAAVSAAAEEEADEKRENFGFVKCWLSAVYKKDERNIGCVQTHWAQPLYICIVKTNKHSGRRDFFCGATAEHLTAFSL